MSQPQIAPEPVDHLAYLPAPSPSPFKLSVLLDFLSARIDPTLTELRSHDLSAPPFLTLIVGSPAHPLAGKSLHSHLVGCFTNNDTRFHFTLYVPVGPDQCLPVPLDWAPLFTALATMCLYPSLPFLVCTPDYTLGTFSAVDDLLACFPRSAALHTFSSTTSLVRPDIFLRLPPATNFTGQPVEGRTDFVSHTPATALEALLTARKTTYEQCPSSRESVEAGSLTADLHFALYCTPYYGYTPASESDFIAMTYALSDFLVSTCFTTTGEPNAALSNLSARPGDLLTILSTIHPAFLSVSPGDGLFILPLTTAKAALRPFPVAWLYHVTEDDCPPPPFHIRREAFSGQQMVLLGFARRVAAEGQFSSARKSLRKLSGSALGVTGRSAKETLSCVSGEKTKWYCLAPYPPNSVPCARVWVWAWSSSARRKYGRGS